MELRQLKHFLAVLEHGSMSKAAEMLGISHQGLSKSLSGLESDLNVQLLVRSARGVTASAYGEVLAEYARFIDGEHDNAILALDALRGGSMGHLTIATGLSGANTVVPEAAARLLERRPGTSLTLLTGPYGQYRAAIEEGEIALFVGSQWDETVSPLLTVETLFDDHDYVVARREHPLVCRDDVRLDDFSHYPWIFTVGALEFRRKLVKWFESEHVAPPRRIIETDSVDVTKATLLRGDFLAQLPRHCIANEEAAGMLAVVAFDSPAWTREVSMIYRRRGVRFGLLDPLMEELRRAAQALRTAPRSVSS